MGVQVMYFGMLAEITGQGSEQWVIDEQLTVFEFRRQVEVKYPSFREKKFKVAINKQIVDDSTLVPQHGELALLPPFAGG